MAAVKAMLAALVNALRPEPGTTEGAVMLGLLLLGIGLALVWVPLALIIPGLLILAIGLGFSLQRKGSD